MNNLSFCCTNCTQHTDLLFAFLKIRVEGIDNNHTGADHKCQCQNNSTEAIIGCNRQKAIHINIRIVNFKFELLCIKIIIQPAYFINFILIKGNISTELFFTACCSWCILCNKSSRIKGIKRNCMLRLSEAIPTRV